MNNSIHPIDYELPPTGDEWKSASFNLSGPVEGSISGAAQVSITATGTNGSVSIGTIFYRWRTDWGFDNLIEIGECPSAPLPGAADPTPQAPTARVLLQKTVTTECSSLTYYSAAGEVSDLFEFDASTSTDPNIEPLNYLWDFKDGTTAEGAKSSHVFTKPGIFFVTLSATDPGGKSDTKTLPLLISSHNPANHSPASVFTASRYNLIKPFTNAFLWGDVSYDTDGDRIDHVWYSDYNSEPVYGAKVEMDIPTASWVTLGVSDGRGGIGYLSKRFQVAEYPGQDCEVTYGSYSGGTFWMKVKLFNNTASPLHNWQSAWTTTAKLSSMQLNTNDKYTFKTSGDQAFSVSGESIPEHSWVEINLVGTSATDVRAIGFKPQNGLKCLEHLPPPENLAPIAKITMDSATGTAPFKVNFSAAGSNDPEGKEIFSYSWDFGDGTYGVGKTVSHTYESKGNYHVGLTVSTAAKPEANDIGRAFETVSVDGNQSIGCQPSIIPTGNADEYIIKAVYWHKDFNPTNFNSNPNPVYLTTGRLSLSTPVTITQAAAETGIKLNMPTDVISFNINKQLQPGSTEGVRIIARIDDINKTFATGCSFK